MTTEKEVGYYQRKIDRLKVTAQNGTNLLYKISGEDTYSLGEGNGKFEYLELVEKYSAEGVTIEEINVLDSGDGTMTILCHKEGVLPVVTVSKADCAMVSQFGFVEDKTAMEFVYHVLDDENVNKYLMSPLEMRQTSDVKYKTVAERFGEAKDSFGKTMEERVYDEIIPVDDGEEVPDLPEYTDPKWVNRLLAIPGANLALR